MALFFERIVIQGCFFRDRVVPVQFAILGERRQVWGEAAGMGTGISPVSLTRNNLYRKKVDNVRKPAGVVERVMARGSPVANFRSRFPASLVKSRFPVDPERRIRSQWCERELSQGVQAMEAVALAHRLRPSRVRNCAAHGRGERNHPYYPHHHLRWDATV